MNDDINLRPLAVTISREELLAVLNVLRAPTIPGLDREPSGELTPDQEAFALVVARRALLARDLAQMRADGEFLLQRGLLAVVGACAYAQVSVLAYHWPAGAQAPERFFGHIRGEDVAAHERPSAVLHRFTMLPSKEALVDQLLAFCQFDAAPPPVKFDLAVPREEFADARQLAGGGDAPGATALLARAGVAAEAAAALAATWAAAPGVSALQTLKQQGNQTVRTREFTLVQNGQYAWWFAAEPGVEARASIRVKTVSRQEMRDLLIRSL